MQQVRISDITMKQAGRAVDYTLTFKEKLELSKLLDRLGVSVIELEGVQQAKIDSLRIKSVAAAVRDSVVAVPVQLDRDNVRLVWNALKEARHPRLQVPAPVSPVQMEYLFHKKPSAMLEAIEDTVRACRELTEDVEFIADDATRSDAAFLHQAITAAIQAGASTVTVCDAAGSMLPQEFSSFLDGLYQAVPALRDVCLAVACSDELSMADACAVAAVCRGAREVKAAAYPVNTASLAHVSRVLTARGDACGVRCLVRTTEINRILRQVAWMCQTGRSKKSPFDNGVQDREEEIALTGHDNMAAVLREVEKLGYDLSEEDGQKVFEAFTAIAKRKDSVSSRELDAIVASAAMQVPPTYHIESYVIHSSNVITATAHMRLRRGEETMESVCAGDGPVDASFLAIEQILGRHYELDDFQIRAVTEGREAMGEAVVKLRSNGKLYSGRGISTDIIGSSIMAYINALNKIVYEEEEG